MEIYIIRHTKVAVGRETCYGQTNVPLAETFSEEVAQFKADLPNDFDAVFSSPLQRTTVLAQALNYGDISFDSNLMEMNFGEWENKKWNDINPDELNTWMNDFVNQKTPNGENLKDVFERLKSFFDTLRQQTHKKVLVVTHAGIIRCIWAYILEIPLQNIFKIPVGHNEIFVLKLSPDKKTDQIKRVK
jgi:alpha-ribazole phosphatase